MDVRDTSKVTESDTQEESVHDVTRQDEVDPKSESQFSSFMSYHEGESSSLDPGTNGQELSKSPIEDSTRDMIQELLIKMISTHMIVI